MNYYPPLEWQEYIEEMEDYPDYFLTDHGRVFHWTEASGYVELSQRLHRGYLRVNVSKNGETVTLSVHRLVAETWLGKPKGLWVNHIDEDKTNNKLSNLEWVTASQNRTHGTSIARSTATRKKYRSTKVLQLTTEGKLVKEWNSAKDIHKALSIRYGTIKWAIQSYPLECNGYLWVRKDLYKPHN